MDYNKKLVSFKLKKWDHFLDSYSLPKWDDLPDLDLYMDQVIILLTQYLNYMPQDEGREKLITSSIINNYVRMKLIPAPQRKKYSKVHLAYLIMICTLKQSLSISHIQKLLPSGLTRDELRPIYDDFVDTYTNVSRFFLKNARSASTELLPDNDDPGAGSVPTLIISAAIVSSLSRFLAEKLLGLKNTEFNMEDSLQNV